MNPHQEVAQGVFGDDGIRPLANVPGSSELDTLMIKGQQANRGLLGLRPVWDGGTGAELASYQRIKTMGRDGGSKHQRA